MSLPPSSPPKVGIEVGVFALDDQAAAPRLSLSGDGVTSLPIDIDPPALLWVPLANCADMVCRCGDSISAASASRARGLASRRASQDRLADCVVSLDGVFNMGSDVVSACV